MVKDGQVKSIRSLETLREDGINVNDKKIKIKAEDMERLQSLLREEEARFDAINPSDAELEEMEKELQQKLKRMAAGHSGEMAQSSWAAKEKLPQFEASSAFSPDQNDLEKPYNVVPLRKKPLKWATWGGALAAAALALFVVVPALEKPQPDANDSLMVSKGSSSSLSARCEITVLQTGDGNGNITPAEDGMGYQGPAGTAFQLNVRCDRPGFLSVQIDGPVPLSLRNLPLVPGESKGILHEGKLATFVLQYQSAWVISGLLSDREISSEAALPRSESEAQSVIGSASLLWFDRIAVKGTNS